jgi:hypothetical protein
VQPRKYTGRSLFMSGLCYWKTSCKLNTKYQFKVVYFVGVRGVTSSSYAVYGCTTSGHTDLQRICLLCIQYIYVLYILFIYFSCNENVRYASLVFGTVQSDRTVVVLLHNTLCPYLAPSVMLQELSWIIRMLIWANLTLWYVNNLFTIFKLAYDV